ncbi:hypothetical protein DFH11DRAFT_637286 [Phellopilus nigrolimitatus]|nr:hypothetical protein DFH11DRAFT_637286 [Phellopilus nigrolimitatus]
MCKNTTSCKCAWAGRAARLFQQCHKYVMASTTSESGFRNHSKATSHLDQQGVPASNCSHSRQRTIPSKRCTHTTSCSSRSTSSTRSTKSSSTASSGLHLPEQHLRDDHGQPAERRRDGVRHGLGRAQRLLHLLRPLTHAQHQRRPVPAVQLVLRLCRPAARSRWPRALRAGPPVPGLLLRVRHARRRPRADVLHRPALLHGRAGREPQHDGRHA